MQDAQQEIQKLQEIIHQYTTFFIIFDIIFFITIILIILFAIQYLKSRKGLKTQAVIYVLQLRGRKKNEHELLANSTTL